MSKCQECSWWIGNSRDSFAQCVHGDSERFGKITTAGESCKYFDQSHRGFYPTKHDKEVNHE